METGPSNISQAEVSKNKMILGNSRLISGGKILWGLFQVSAERTFFSSQLFRFHNVGRGRVSGCNQWLHLDRSGNLQIISTNEGTVYTLDDNQIWQVKGGGKFLVDHSTGILFDSFTGSRNINSSLSVEVDPRMVTPPVFSRVPTVIRLDLLTGEERNPEVVVIDWRSNRLLPRVISSLVPH